MGSNKALHCFVLQRKLIYSIKNIVIRRQNIFTYLKVKTLSLIKRTLAKDRTLSILEKRSSSYHKEVQRITTENVLENVFFRM